MGRNILRALSSLSLLTLLSRLLGLIREMTKAALLGTGALSDAFSVAFMLPNLFRRLFAEGSIAVAFIPTFKEYLIKNVDCETRDFLCSFWSFMTFLVSLAVALGIAFAPVIMPFFALEELDEAVLLTRVMFPYLLFISIAAFFQGILNSVYSFVPSALAPILLNIAVIACAWLLSGFVENPARAMAAGVFAGGFLEAAIQLPFVLKRGFRFKWTALSRALRNEGTKKVLRLVLPTIVGMAAYQLNDIVSTALAGNAGAGVVSSLQYSLRLQELFLGVFAVSLGTVLLPRLAENSKRGEWAAYNSELENAVALIALITIPVMFFSFSQGAEIIRLLFQSRAFDERSVALTNEAFMFHIAGLFFIALNRILAPAFYAQSDSFSPTLAGIISFAVNIVLAFALTPVMAGGGIALALSAAGAVNTLFLFVFLRKNQNIAVCVITYSSLRYVIKIVICSIIAIAPVHILSSYTERFIAGFNIKNKLITLALPLVFHTLIFSALGIILLVITKDRFIDRFRVKFGKTKLL
ncbi:MAG: murein biosynthesis integral membrane protein MurJ [Spirochaetaceae bacterium]|jgi:putative peptidoglycan lipid II flippase|nr:murein biosynthesis integral membrane protein MurJ [Spirochaetaceae bacterium]